MQDVLLDITTQPQDVELPDTATNLIVALPPDMQLNLDDVPQPMTPVTDVTPCIVKLYRCDIMPTNPTPRAPIKVNVVVKYPKYDLWIRDSDNQNTVTSTYRSQCTVSQNVSYVSMFQDSSSEDTLTEDHPETIGCATKQEPSHYQLAADKYM